MLELDAVTERLEAVDQATGNALLVTLVEMQRAELAVGGLLGEQVVGDDQDGVADRDQGLLLAPPTSEAVILGRQVGAAAAAGGLCRLDQRRAEPWVTFAGRAAAAFAGALVVARAHARPGRQVACRREAVQV